MIPHTSQGPHKPGKFNVRAVGPPNRQPHGSQFVLRQQSLNAGSLLKPRMPCTVCGRSQRFPLSPLLVTVGLCPLALIDRQTRIFVKHQLQKFAAGPAVGDGHIQRTLENLQECFINHSTEIRDCTRIQVTPLQHCQKHTVRRYSLAERDDRTARTGVIAPNRRQAKNK